jgi:predicted secreted Zn-dependent protease
MTTDKAINAAVESDRTAAWLAYEAQAKEDKAIAARAEEIAWSNDGIADAVGSTSDASWERFCSAVRRRDEVAVGREFIAMVRAHEDGYAYKKACSEIERERNEWDGD